MRNLSLASAAVLLTAAPALAELPSASELPANIVRISETVPGMGEHWADPKDMPLGPIYGVHEGRVVFLEFMISRDDFAAGKSWTDLKSKAAIDLPPVEHVDIEFLPKGHHGFEVPHYDIHMYFVPHEEHLTFRAAQAQAR